MEALGSKPSTTKKKRREKEMKRKPKIISKMLWKM
jgi:hypothetical protein